MPESEKKLPDPESKSQRKRDMLALQDVGKKLVDLPEHQLLQLTLPAELLKAIQFAHTLTSHEAMRRHMQFIGKLMRKVDCEEIVISVAKIQKLNRDNTKRFHDQENWRDKLIAEGDDAINIFLQQFPETDRQKLRQLVRKAQQDKAKQKDTGGSTQLFRYLREVMG